MTEEIDLRCPEEVASNAAKGLELRQKFGRGGTEVGVARARELFARTALSPHTIKRMVSFFARHEVDNARSGRGVLRGGGYRPAARPSPRPFAFNVPRSRG